MKDLGNDIATSTPEVFVPTIIPPQPPVLPLTQIEDEYFEIDEHFNSKGLLYCQTLYAEDLKLKKDKLSEYKEDLLPIQLEDTDLPEADILTLYVRGKGTGTSTLKIDDTEIITLILENTGWLTKWDSVSGKWTQEQINNAYVEFTGDIKVSNIRLYAEDQHSLEDNFDLYNDGDLNGQGSWSGNAAFDVQGVTVQAGAKAVKATAAGVYIEKTFTADPDGNQVFYIRSNATDELSHTRLYAGAVHVLSLVMFADATIALGHGDGGGGDTNTTILDPYSANQWYKIEIEWRTSDNKVRARVDDGTWTDWVTAHSDAAFTDMTKVRLSVYGGAREHYWDEFGEPAAPPVGVPSRLASQMVG